MTGVWVAKPAPAQCQAAGATGYVESCTGDLAQPWETS